MLRSQCVHTRAYIWRRGYGSVYQSQAFRVGTLDYQNESHATSVHAVLHLPLPLMQLPHVRAVPLFSPALKPVFGAAALSLALPPLAGYSIPQDRLCASSDVVPCSPSQIDIGSSTFGTAYMRTVFLSVSMSTDGQRANMDCSVCLMQCPPSLAPLQIGQTRRPNCPARLWLCFGFYPVHWETLVVLS